VKTQSVCQQLKSGDHAAQDQKQVRVAIVETCGDNLDCGIATIMAVNHADDIYSQT